MCVMCVRTFMFRYGNAGQNDKSYEIVCCQILVSGSNISD
jgi:hypothetical protein